MADTIIGRLLYLIGIDKSGLESDIKGVQDNIKTMASTTQAEVSRSTMSFDQLKVALKEARIDVINLTKDIEAFRTANPMANEQNISLQTFSQRLESAKVRVAELETQMNGLKGGFEKTSQSGYSMSVMLDRLMIRLAAYFVLREAFRIGKEAIDDAAAIEGVQRAFDNLNKPDLLDDLRQATRGATADIDLMKMAVKANNYGIPFNILVDGLKLVSATAINTGGDITKMSDEFVEGIGKRSVGSLKDLQISSSDLQTEIKKTGDYYSAVGDLIKEKFDEAGNVADTTATKISDVAAAWKNLLTVIGQKLPTKSFSEGLAAELNDLMLSIKNPWEKIKEDFLNPYNDPSRKADLQKRGIIESPGHVPQYNSIDANGFQVKDKFPIQKTIEPANVDFLMKSLKDNTMNAQLDNKGVSAAREEEKKGLEDLLKQNIVLDSQIKIKQRLLELNKQGSSDSKKSQKLDDSAQKEYYNTLKFDAVGYFDYKKGLIDKESQLILNSTKSKIAAEQYTNEEMKKLIQSQTDWEVEQTRKKFAAEDLARRLPKGEVGITGSYEGLFSGMSMDSVKQPKDKSLNQVDTQAVDIMKKAQNADPFKAAVSGLSSVERLTSSINSMLGKAADPFTKGLQEALSIINSIYGVIKSIEAITQITGLLSSVAAAAPTGGLSLLSAFPFANGADFIVPPGFNNDSFHMRAQSGEHVSITPAYQMSSQNISNSQILNKLDQTNSSIQAMNMNMSNNQGKIPPIHVFSSDPTVRVKYDIGIRNGLENKGVNTSQIRAGGTT